MNIFKRNNENIIKAIYNEDRLKRYSMFFIGLFIVSVAFNIFILPNNLVYGVGGIAVILNKLFNYDPATVILIASSLLLVMSYFTLGKEKTKYSILGSMLYPVFVKFTEPIPEFIKFDVTDPIVIAIFGAVFSGFGLGLIFKSGFTTGGTDILNQMVSKYFKMSLGNSMYFTDGLIIFSAAFVFGWTKVMYSLITLYVISIMTDKVVLGISASKTFFIITKDRGEVKKFVMETLGHGVTSLSATGGFTGENQNVLMCTVPTKEYFILKEGIEKIDPSAFLVVVDAYEQQGGA